jgi:hypothetical protein
MSKGEGLFPWREVEHFVEKIPFQWMAPEQCGNKADIKSGSTFVCVSALGSEAAGASQAHIRSGGERGPNLAVKMVRPSERIKWGRREKKTRLCGAGFY